MNDMIVNSLQGHWTPQEIAINVDLVLNTLIALVLGLLVGYERSYRGRAAGMRTYGFVCMASCALTVTAGYPNFWYGGHVDVVARSGDASRIIQAIISGIGFLGAGVIMREGMNISGLMTAASIWTVAIIGVMVGVGFYGAACMMAFISMSFMMWGAKIENFLPSRHAIAVRLNFDRDSRLPQEMITRIMYDNGYEVANGSFTIDQHDGLMEWRFVGVSLGKGKGTSFFTLSESFRATKGIHNFHISHARN